MNSNNILVADIDDRVLDFLRGENLSSEEITNGLRWTIPEITKGMVIKSLQSLKDKGDVNKNLTTNLWRCQY